MTVLGAGAQDRWGIQVPYLARDGKPVFLIGANYIPSTGWLTILENWKPEAVDRDIAALRKLGITSLRFPPLWPLLQPEIDRVSQEKLERVSQLIAIAHRHGVAVQVGPITGWMSGATFLPKWADGNLFTDPRLVDATAKLVSELARTLKDNPGLQGYDFGNEVNVLPWMMHLQMTPEQTSQWMKTIYQAFRAADPHHPVTDGVGGFDELFNIWSLAASSDYLSVHSYAYFNGTLELDPWIGQRTTYAADHATAYAAMTGKPVLVQEIGCSEAWAPKSEIGKFLRLTLMSAWAQGAAGYFWWGSHNIDTNYRPPAQYMVLKYSHPSFAEGRFDSLEYSMGLLDTNNQPKRYALEYQRWAAVIDKLGVGWRDELPICYVLEPQPGKSARGQSTAFVLAKQIHMQVRMWPEWKPIPADAAAVVIANFALSAKGKDSVGRYLQEGGVVYQSYASDFPQALTVRDSAETLSSPTLTAAQAEGLFSDSQRVCVGAPLKLKDVSPVSGRDTQVLLALRATGGERRGRGLYFKTSVGKGVYYYLAANVEEALSSTYDPWDSDDSNLIYSVLRPESGVNIDSKYVELAAKTRGHERLFLLLNHSNRFQDVVFRSAEDIQLRDYMSHAPLGAGREFPLRLLPGDVLVAEPSPKGR